MSASLSIGDFARATHLTIKTLRHYHRIGLLEPVEVDAETGYRRYGSDQIPPALVIRRFRALEMPLDDIREVLTAPDVATRNAIIAVHLERLEAALEHTRSAAESLRGLLGAPTPADPAQLEHISMPPTPAAAIQGVIELDGGAGAAFIAGALAELRAALAAQRLPALDSAGGIFSDELFSEARGQATLFLPCPESFRPAGRVELVVIPSVELATTIHSGSHDDIDRSYGALAGYVAQHALGVPGPIREYYLSDSSSSADPADWRTRIGWPIFQTAPRPGP